MKKLLFTFIPIATFAKIEPKGSIQAGRMVIGILLLAGNLDG